MFDAPTQRSPRSAAALLTLLAACSPSSEPVASVGGLGVTDSVAVVATVGDPLDVDSQAITDFPADADFFEDPVIDRVFDESQKVLDSLNQILCAIDQTGYTELVNQGLYTAQMDLSECSEEGDPGFNALQLWTVNSLRTGPFEPHRVQVWAPDQSGDPMGPGPQGTMFVDVVVTQGVSAEHPFGIFTMNYAAADSVEGLSNPSSCGIFECFDAGDGMTGFSFYDILGRLDEVPEPGEESSITQLEVRVSADFSVGAAHVTRRFRNNFSDPGTGGQNDSGIQEQEFKIAFDEDNLLRQTGEDSPETLSKANFSICHRRYNLYHLEGPLAGQRLRRQSDFPIVTADGRRGFASYDGVWLDDGSTLLDGDAVIRDSGGPMGGETYTAVVSPGRLLEQTQNFAPLADFLGERFLWFNGGGGSRSPGFISELIVLPTDPDPAFFETAFFDPFVEEWFPVDPPEQLFPFPGEVLVLNFLDRPGEAIYVEDGNLELSILQTIIASRESTLFEEGPALELLGYFDVIRRELTGFEAEQGDVYYPPTQYTRNEFRQNSLTLFVDDPVFGTGVSGLAPGQSYAGGPFGGGFRSGPMVTRDVFLGLGSPDELFEQEVFFTWETGQPFQDLVSLRRDDGSYVRFDPPLFFPYTHDASKDANGDASNDGMNQPLSYHGSGALFGIPHVERDLDGDGLFDGFFPLFNIADGVVIVSDEGESFVVKAIDRERILEPSTEGPGDLTLEIADTLSVPDGTGYRTPSIGPRPSVPGPPAVVDGEVQQ